MLLNLELRTLAPLALSIKRATGNELETQSFIPGSAVRGALASAWLEVHGQPNDPGEEFRNLFLSGRVRFGDLSVAGSNPPPLSARECAQPDCPKGVVDHLLQAAAKVPIAEECSVCKGKRRRVASYIRADRREGYIRVSPRTRRIAHTAIEPRLLRVANQQFHAAEVLAEDQTFSGTIRSDDALTEALTDLLDRVPQLWLGRGRTRGQGLVDVKVSGGMTEAMSTEMIAAFSDAATATFAHLSRMVLFSCTFRSRAIVIDEWLMSKAMLDAVDLDPRLSGYERLASFHKMAQIVGWNAKAGLPKPEVSALDTGSSYLFGKEGADAPAEYEMLANVLGQTESNGVGERLAEGFGDVVFCDRFHLDRAEAF